MSPFLILPLRLFYSRSPLIIYLSGLNIRYDLALGEVMKRILCVLLVILATLVMVSAQSEENDMGVNVRLAAAMSVPQVSRLVVVDDGEWVDLAQDFTLPTMEGFFVAWSPDCNQIAFTTDVAPATFESDDFGIFTYNFQDNDYRRLVPTELAFPIIPTWSPDGQKVYFMRFTDNGRISYVMDTATGEIMDFQLPYYSFGVVTWAIDGNSIAITTYSNEWSMIYLVDLKSDEPNWTQVFEEYTFVFDIQLNAVGDEITFIHGEFGASDVYTLDLLTGEISRLTAESAQRGSLALSPDERMVAYNEGAEVYIMNVDGTDAHEISDNAYEVYGQARIFGWTKDNAYVVYENASESTNLIHDVYAAAVDGSGVIQLTDTPLVDSTSNTWYACFPQED